MRLEDTLNLALRMGESSLLTGRVISTEEIIRRVDAVSPSDVKRVAEDVLNMNRMNIAAVGPERDGDKIRSIVGV
ncbi:MAG TPA: insulinase family protein [Firmicutes bacterium]|nr:insulinase family protein [Bacillota bacterium]